jgi:hypothetical protein
MVPNEQSFRGFPQPVQALETAEFFHFFPDLPFTAALPLHKVKKSLNNQRIHH